MSPRLAAAPWASAVPMCPTAYREANADAYYNLLLGQTKWQKTAVDIRGTELFVKHATTPGSVMSLDAGLALAKYLASPKRPAGLYLAGARVVELGSGAGCAGLAAAALGARVTLTDTAVALPLTARNAEKMMLTVREISVHSGDVKVMELEWFQAAFWRSEVLDGPPQDIVLCADVVHSTDPIPHIVAVVARLLRAGTTMLWAHIRPDKDVHLELWRAVAASGLVAAWLPMEDGVHQMHKHLEMYVVVRKGGRVDPRVAGDALGSLVLDKDGRVLGVKTHAAPLCRA